ncbi:MAG: cellulase, partial [Pedobacter sp.]
AVWGGWDETVPSSFDLLDEATGAVVYTSKKVMAYGAYGPFKRTARLNFTTFKKPGRFKIRASGVTSPVVIINDTVYKHAADFTLRYMRQQRSKFNPFLKDSCHTYDGFVLYGSEAGIKDSTFYDASGGWHDASDYLQYSTTSANAAYHLLAAYRDFPKTFGDKKQANGLDGSNGVADVMDEAKWGLEWLLKMHPKKDIMFNQLADDRDHRGMRIPKEDNYYGRGFERPLYFISGKPQQRGKFMNNTTGTSSTAAKFSSAFSLGTKMFKDDREFASVLKKKAQTAYAYAGKIPGVTQTASVVSPYIYAEDNWVDDMELASVEYGSIRSDKKLFQKAFEYAQKEPVTPWMGKDTAAHYQYYPFHNFGHYELAKADKGKVGTTAVAYYKDGIEKVKNKAIKNGFYRGIPFIWCSNNLTTSFAIQTYLYKQLTNDTQYDELAQANFDWLFGCNIWGTSMVYGLPEWGDTPDDPHSAFTRIGKYPIDGGLVDGPVYGNIYKNLIGITLTKPDAYAKFQSDLVVYHDDYGDYSTNEPTMDGTASLIYLLAAFNDGLQKPNDIKMDQGAIIRGNESRKALSIVFTGDKYGDGGEHIARTLKKNNINASFFFTGRFYRNKNFSQFIRTLKEDGNYLGAHSDQHLLYADWKKRDSLLVTEQAFKKDLEANYRSMKEFGISKQDAGYFLPPFEWYNKKVAGWTHNMGLQLINMTPGTRSAADYTFPETGKPYVDSETIYSSIIKQEQEQGLNGYILLLHIGTDSKRTDKFYFKLDELIGHLKSKGYDLVKINELLNNPGEQVGK